MKEKLIKMKRALVIVDMVKGFKEFGNMAITDVGYIDPEVVRLVNMFLQNEDDVISVQEGHIVNSQEFQDFPGHCILGTEEAQLIDILKPFEKAMKVIRKNSTSGFVTKEFQEYLEKNKNGLKEIVFVGVCLDICVINIAIPTKMFFNENNIACDVIVPENATETFDSPIPISKSKLLIVPDKTVILPAPPSILHSFVTFNCLIILSPAPNSIDNF